MTDRAEVVVIGAGIAGASFAYFLSQRGITDIIVLEREAHAAYHATGRSAATLVELDPIYTIQRLKTAGGRFLRRPPDGFSENPVLDLRGVVALYREPQWTALRRNASRYNDEGLRVDLITPADANRRAGGLLREDSFDGAALLPDDGFIDVHELLSSYMAHARRRGVRFRFDCEAKSILTEGGRCRGVVTSGGRIEAAHVVNAGGAWVGPIARMAGALPIELTPLRRSIAIFAAPDGADTARWPLVWSEPHHLYFRPEPGGILFSPMDETPQPPCDAAADEVVIAEGLERLRDLAPALVPRSLKHRWAGLRTFSPDGVPVIGPDLRLPGFFWLAGQGGCGIETSPAVGEIAADVFTTGATDRFDYELLTPARFAV